MLSVGKLAAEPDAGRYYEDTLALGREDYYAGEGEGSGRWLGAGAVALDLDGGVQDGQTVRLLSGLTRRWARCWAGRWTTARWPAST